MPRLVGRMNKWVTLSRCPQTTNDADGYDEPLSPEGSWAEIRPLPPSEDDRTVRHEVRMRFHPQVTMDTQVQYLDENRQTATNPTGARKLFVKGFQDVSEDNDEMRLICVEVIP